MSMKDVMLIKKYKKKDGTEGTIWRTVGSCFGTNKDGSLTFNIDLFEGVQFQIRDRKDKETEADGGF